MTVTDESEGGQSEVFEFTIIISAPELQDAVNTTADAEESPSEEESSTVTNETSPEAQ